MGAFDDHVAPLSPAAIRALDRTAIHDLRVPGLLLMERAAESLCQHLLGRFPDRVRFGVRVLVGKGNNGGDGLAVNRMLRARGISSSCWLAFDPAPVSQGDADRNLWLETLYAEGPLAGASELTRLLSSPEPFGGVWVDALLGTGFRGQLRSNLVHLIGLLNERNEAVYSVDIPSGLGGESGSPSPVAVRAMATGTLGAMKPVLLTSEAAPYCGDAATLPIGWPLRLINGNDPAA